MRVSFSVLIVLLTLAAPLGAQPGAVTGLQVSTGDVQAGTPVTFTVTGTNPCGAVEVAFGDGNAITYPITGLPHTVTYIYRRAGTFAVTARGQGRNCQGKVAGRPAVVRVRPAPAPPAPPPPIDPADGRLDRNGDGVITRAEWPAGTPRFETFDGNRDNVLSGDEVREAQRDADRRQRLEERESRRRERDEAAGRRFDDLDRNRDGRITRDEWNGSRDEFDRLDRNGDWVLSPAEVAPRGQVGGQVPLPPAIVQVPANRAWTDTGLIVQPGDRVTFEATGQVRLSDNNQDVAGASGSVTGRRAPNAPLPQAPAGALIARVGDAPPAAVGAAGAVLRVASHGRLYLGVNDDYVGDNAGAFRVRVVIAR